MQSRSLSLCVAAALLLVACGDARAQRAPDTPEPQSPNIAPASDEGQLALQTFRIPSDLTAGLFAAEPLLANPVAFFVDSQGRVFVCETFRQNAGVTDNRQHDQTWLDADLAARTVEDRHAYHLRLLGDEAVTYTAQDDRIRLLQDTDGDGVADDAVVFADHFNALVDGTGAGVLEHQGDVYYTCIPHLWLLRDTDGDGRSDERESLHYGFGVRVAFRGHDAHGLCLGPDGRLYFSIGDRGYNIETADARLENPESGAVFRCELDGSNLEIFATGMRNPQELAFDEYGNLFTGDNNSDSGDRARWVYVVEGGDSGWRMSYQYLADRGPFNREKLWHPFHAEQPAYIIPPVANIADGPSGLAYYPGTGFADDYRGRFFLCDFRGTPAQSGVRSFRMELRGAFFELVDQQRPLWNMLATDVQFGPDGGLYVSDWVFGWNGEGKGRIYRFASRAHLADPMVGEVQQLLAADLSSTAEDVLAELLAHPDQRVRSKSQYALATRGARDVLRRAALEQGDLLARLHGLWGLAQLARHERSTAAGAREVLSGLLNDSQAEIRAHAARLLGELGAHSAAPALVRRLADPHSRVRYFAALSLAKVGDASALPPVLQMLAQNADADPILRHGGIMALAGIADVDQLSRLVHHPSRSVRLAAVVALRRQQSPGLAEFLEDDDPAVVVEAARAIHDVPIPAALPRLAELVDRELQDDALLRRALNANFRLGTRASAMRLAQYAARDSGLAPMRLEAIKMLGDWSQPSPRDRVLGMWRPLPRRDAEPARSAVRSTIARMTDGSAELRLAAARVGAQFGLQEAAPLLEDLLDTRSLEGRQRADALEALVAIVGAASFERVRAAVQDPEPLVRAQARRLVAQQDPQGAIPLLEQAALGGEHVERQSALGALGQIQSPEANRVLADVLQKLVEGQYPQEAHLEALAAAAGRDEPRIRRLLDTYEASRDPELPASQYQEALYGGDAERGRQIFFERTQVSCLRCHKVGPDGGEVGPDLTKIAADKNREYLLEAIVDPSRTIAKDFESVMLADDEGRIHTGILKDEDDRQLTIMTADGRTVTFAQESIEARRPGQSAMPADLVQHLSKSDVRDLVEFLAQLTGRRQRTRNRAL